MQSFLRIIIQIFDSNLPNPEIETEKNSLFLSFLGVRQSISVCIMFPYGWNAFSQLKHQVLLLLASKRNASELAVSSSLPKYMLSSLRSREVWHLSLIHMRSQDCQVLEAAATSAVLTTWVWACRVLMALMRWSTPKMVLVKESTAFPAWSSVMRNLPFSLVPTAAPFADRLWVGVSAVLSICWLCLQWSGRWPLPLVCVGTIDFHRAITESRDGRVWKGPLGII